MAILAKLMESGEIISKEAEALLLFFQILCDASPDEKKRDVLQKEHKLEQLFKEYRSASNRYVNV